MKEAFEKIKERLEEQKKLRLEAYEKATWTPDKIMYVNSANAYADAIEIVNQVAEEYELVRNTDKFGNSELASANMERSTLPTEGNKKH